MFNSREVFDIKLLNQLNIEAAIWGLEKRGKHWNNYQITADLLTTELKKMFNDLRPTELANIHDSVTRKMLQFNLKCAGKKVFPLKNKDQVQIKFEALQLQDKAGVCSVARMLLPPPIKGENGGNISVSQCIWTKCA